MHAQTPRTLSHNGLAHVHSPPSPNPVSHPFAFAMFLPPSDDKIVTELKAQRMRWARDPGPHWLSSRCTQNGQNRKWRKWQLTKGREKHGEEKYNTKRVTVLLATALGADMASGSWVTDFFPGKEWEVPQDWDSGQPRELLSLATRGYVVLASCLVSQPEFQNL